MVETADSEGSHPMLGARLMLFLNSVNNDLMRPRWNVHTRLATAGPPDPHARRLPRGSEHLHRTVLGPVSRARLNLPDGPHPRTVGETHLRADRVGIGRRASNADPQPGLRATIVKQSCRGGILRDDQVESAVAIIVRIGRPPLIAV